MHRWLLAIVSRLVPRDLRSDWLAEWNAELRHREATAERWPAGRRRLALVRETAGGFWDALWLRTSRWSSLRLFARHYQLTLTALASMSLAIAAVSIGVSAYGALLVRTPGVGDPASLRLLHVSTIAEPFGVASYPEFVAYRQRARAFSDIAAFPYSIATASLDRGSSKQQVIVVEVTSNFFDVLGIAPEAGALALSASTDQDAQDVVLSHRYWRELGADPSIVGTTARLNGVLVRIVGVTPDDFRGLLWSFAPDVWIPLSADSKVFGSDPARFTRWNERWLHMVGRLRPAVSDTQAAADLKSVAATLAQDHPETNRGASSELTPLSATPPGDRGWASLVMGALLLVVGLTLVVACANVTNLLLGLAIARRHEMLVRAALGASRWQLAIPLLRESAWLGVASGAIGSVVAWFALTVLASVRLSLGGFLPSLSVDLRPDGVVMAMTVAIGLAAGILVGVAPAIRGTADGLSGAINRERLAGDPRKARVRHALVVIQMTVATVVLVGVGVSIHSLVNLRNAPLGFHARDLVYYGVNLARRGYDRQSGPALYERIREGLASTPGIEAVTLASEAPLTGYETDHVIADGDAPPADGRGAATPYTVVDADYFAALGVDVLSGRTFDSRDRAGAPEVVVINAALARRHWPGRDPVGQRLRVGNSRRPVEVIGVVPDGKYGDLDEATLPFMYFNLAQHYQPEITIIARTRAPRDIVARALQAIDPSIAIAGIGLMSLDDMMRLSLMLPRAMVWTTIVFGVLAFALAAFGLYSTVFYSVSQRRREMGIRTALGASRAHLFALVLRESGWVAFIGGATGLAAGALLLPLAASIFYGISPLEPVVLASVTATSTAITLGTTYLVVRPWTRLAAIDVLRA